MGSLDVVVEEVVDVASDGRGRKRLAWRRCQSPSSSRRPRGGGGIGPTSGIAGPRGHVGVHRFRSGSPQGGDSLPASCGASRWCSGHGPEKSAVASRIGGPHHRESIGASLPVRILEVGTSLGLGALAMLTGHETALQYVGLEGSPEVAQWAQGAVAPWKGQVVTGPFERTLPAVLGDGEGWDVVFLDGHHEGAALLDQWQSIRPHLRPGGCVILDDIRWSMDMHAAWLQLAEQPDMVALDLFRMGVLTLGNRGNAPIQRVPTRLLA